MVACSCLVSASSSPTVAHRMTSFSYANDTRTANTNRTVTETAIVQGPLAMDRKFMEEATRPAIESVEKGWGGPFGAVIVRDGEIIGRGQTRVLFTGCPVFHAEITAIIDASSQPKDSTWQRPSRGTILEVIARPPGSPDLVPERARTLKGCEIYIRRAVPDVRECDLLVAHRPSLFRLQPGGYDSHRLLRCFPVRRLRAAVGTAAGHLR